MVSGRWVGGSVVGGFNKTLIHVAKYYVTKGEHYSLERARIC